MKRNIGYLIYELTNNSRQSNSELARKLGITPQGVAYLNRKLSSESKIIDKTILLNTLLLGYTGMIMFFNLKHYSTSKLKEIIGYLKETPEISSIHLGQYGYDCIAEYNVMSISAIERVLAELLEKHSEDIESPEYSTITSKWHYGRQYQRRTKPRRGIEMSAGHRNLQLTKRQYNLIKILIQDASAPISELSKKTKLSPQTTRKELGKMENDQIIMGYTCNIRYDKIGISKFFIFVKLSNADIAEPEKFVRFLRNNKNIIEAYRMIGYYDYMLVIESYGDIPFIESLRNEFSPQKYTVARLGGTFKDTPIDPIMLRYE
ncbi:MAG: Lrp/AsnC family transcriptional regulator [Candidatus Woesearchaeota archaeon]